MRCLTALPIGTTVARRLLFPQNETSKVYYLVHIILGWESMLGKGAVKKVPVMSILYTVLQLSSSHFLPHTFYHHACGKARHVMLQFSHQLKSGTATANRMLIVLEKRVRSLCLHFCTCCVHIWYDLCRLKNHEQHHSCKHDSYRQHSGPGLTLPKCTSGVGLARDRNIGEISQLPGYKYSHSYAVFYPFLSPCCKTWPFLRLSLGTCGRSWSSFLQGSKGHLWHPPGCEQFSYDIIYILVNHLVCVITVVQIYPYIPYTYVNTYI